MAIDEEIVERVAKRIHSKAQDRQREHRHAVWPSWDLITPQLRASLMIGARSALEVVYELEFGRL